MKKHSEKLNPQYFSFFPDWVKGNKLKMPKTKMCVINLMKIWSESLQEQDRIMARLGPRLLESVKELKSWLLITSLSCHQNKSIHQDKLCECAHVISKAEALIFLTEKELAVSNLKNEIKAMKSKKRVFNGRNQPSKQRR